MLLPNLSKWHKLFLPKSETGPLAPDTWSLLCLPDSAAELFSRAGSTGLKQDTWLRRFPGYWCFVWIPMDLPGPGQPWGPRVPCCEPVLTPFCLPVCALPSSLPSLMTCPLCLKQLYKKKKKKAGDVKLFTLPQICFNQ